MGEDRSKNANPFGVGFLPKRSSEETRGRSIDPGNGFPSPKNSVHFRVTGAGEEQDVSVSTKTFSLLGLSVCNVRLISDVQQPQESSPPAVPFSSSLYWESTVPPTSTKALHTHTQSQCAIWLIPGQHFFWKAEESQPLTIVWSSFILPSCPVFYGT